MQESTTQAGARRQIPHLGNGQRKPGRFAAVFSQSRRKGHLTARHHPAWIRHWRFARSVRPALGLDDSVPQAVSTAFTSDSRAFLRWSGVVVPSAPPVNARIWRYSITSCAFGSPRPRPIWPAVGRLPMANGGTQLSHHLRPSILHRVPDDKLSFQQNVLLRRRLTLDHS